MSNIETSGRVLNKAAYIYDLVQPLVTFGQEGRINAAMADGLNLEAGSSILDVGCGTGLMTAELVRLNRNCQVVGIDASASMVKVAEKKRGSKQCSFLQAVAEDLPFEDGSFDAVTSALFFHHIDMTLKKKALSEIYRVLKSSGTLLVADMGIPYSRIGRITSYLAWKLYRQPEIRENSLGRLTELVLGSPFENYRELGRFSGYITMFSAEKN